MDKEKGMTLGMKGELFISINKFGDDVHQSGDHIYEVYVRDEVSGNRLFDDQDISREKTIDTLGKLIENILEKGSQKILMRLTSYQDQKIE